jgi:hypothetical protein
VAGAEGFLERAEPDRRREPLDRGNGAAPSSCTASSRQLRALSPSTSTVQAPQTPCSQPTWVPVRPRSSRRKSLSERRTSTTRSTACPFTASRTRVCMATYDSVSRTVPLLDVRGLHRSFYGIPEASR